MNAILDSLARESRDPVEERWCNSSIVRAARVVMTRKYVACVNTL